MKRFVLVLIILICSFTVFGQSKKTDWEFLNLIGQVKEHVLITYNVKVKEGEIDKKPTKREVQIFNKYGSLVERYFFNISSYNGDIYETLDYKEIYNFDDKAGKIGLDYYDSEGALTSRLEFKKDKLGNIIEELTLVEKVIRDKTTYKYDKKGNLIEKVSSDKGKEIYKYNSNGNISEIEVYSIDYNYLSDKFILVYNDSGRLIEKQRFLNGDSFVYKYVYLYDDQDCMYEVSSINDMDEILEKHLYKYDDKKNISEDTYFNGNELIELIQHQYSFFN